MMTSDMNASLKMIGIVTIWRWVLLSNYGSFFQHWALRIYLQRLGYKVYRVKDERESAFFYSWLQNGLRLFIVGVIHVLCGKNTFRRELASLRYRRQLGKAFCRDYELLVGRIVERQHRNAPIYILGSDQVWSWNEVDKWGLKLPKDAKVFSYAASADWKSAGASSEWRTMAQSGLRRMMSVSVREGAGIDVLKPLIPSGVKLEKCLDPVYLLDECEYDQILSREPIFGCPTLFCYLVNIRAAEHFPIAELEGLSQVLGMTLKIVCVQGAEMLVPQKYRMVVSPRDFLRCIRDAGCVLTNSFHGVSFCIKFRKIFVSLEQVNLRGQDQNERQRDVLSIAGLQSRMTKTINVDTVAALSVEPIDYDSVAQRMRPEIERSKDFLEKALAAADA